MDNEIVVALKSAANRSQYNTDHKEASEEQIRDLVSLMTSCAVSIEDVSPADRGFGEGSTLSAFKAESIIKRLRSMPVGNEIFNALEQAASRCEHVDQRPASSKQVAYLASLVASRGFDLDDEGLSVAHSSAMLSCRRASGLIERIRSMPEMGPDKSGKATRQQVWFLRNMDESVKIKGLTKRQASVLISKIKASERSFRPYRPSSGDCEAN